jgi:hypothetical protein
MSRDPIVDGFGSPEEAAAHAIVVQGGFSTPAIEARRMLRDGGRGAEIARAWFAAHGLDENGVGEAEQADAAAADAMAAAVAAMVQAKGVSVAPADPTTPAAEPAGGDAVAWVPTMAELEQIALSLAVLDDRADHAKERYGEARRSAEEVFAVARRYRIPQVEAALPDGTKLGLISIKQGTTVVIGDENALMLLVATTTPAEIEDFVVPGALTDQRVLDVLRREVPDVVHRRIRPAYRQQLQAEMEERDGHVANPKTGELEQVGKVTRYQPTGEFAYRKDRKKIQALRDAIAAGVISETGEVLALPAAEGGEAA